MIQRLQQHAMPIVIAVAFYVSGFFAMASLLNLNGREIVIGLLAGTISGERANSYAYIAKLEIGRRSNGYWSHCAA